MVFIITGTPESDRNTVGSLFAETLAWEFVDAENLRAQGDVVHPDRTSRTEALSAAISLWIYEWRDVVVSCPALTVGERRQMSTISSLVKVVCLEEIRAAGRARVSDGSAGVAVSLSPSGSHAPRDPDKDDSTLEKSQPVEEIIAELTSALVT